MTAAVDEVLSSVVGAVLVSVEPGEEGTMNNHNPYVLTFKCGDGRIVRIGIDGNCYGCVVAEVLTARRV